MEKSQRHCRRKSHRKRKILTKHVSPLVKPNLSLSDFITQQRLTRRVGIFNHGKKSDKIFRENFLISTETKLQVSQDLKQVLNVNNTKYSCLSSHCNHSSCDNNVSMPHKILFSPKRNSTPRGTSNNSNGSCLSSSHSHLHSSLEPSDLTSKNILNCRQGEQCVLKPKHSHLSLKNIINRFHETLSEKCKTLYQGKSLSKALREQLLHCGATHLSNQEADGLLRSKTLTDELYRTGSSANQNLLASKVTDERCIKESSKENLNDPLHHHNIGVNTKKDNLCGETKYSHEFSFHKITEPQTETFSLFSGGLFISPSNEIGEKETTSFFNDNIKVQKDDFPSVHKIIQEDIFQSTCDGLSLRRNHNLKTSNLSEKTFINKALSPLSQALYTRLSDEKLSALIKSGLPLFTESSPDSDGIPTWRPFPQPSPFRLPADSPSNSWRYPRRMMY